jgi:hypothetical protein
MKMQQKRSEKSLMELEFKMKFDIWVEGFQFSIDEAAMASFVETVEAESFQEACDKCRLAKESLYDSKKFNLLGLQALRQRSRCEEKFWMNKITINQIRNGILNQISNHVWNEIRIFNQISLNHVWNQVWNQVEKHVSQVMIQSSEIIKNNNS